MRFFFAVVVPVCCLTARLPRLPRLPSKHISDRDCIFRTEIAGFGTTLQSEGTTWTVKDNVLARKTELLVRDGNVPKQ
jgi:hypothetical protein